MTARRPAGALLQALIVALATDQDDAALHLLEMAFQAQVRVAHVQHPGVDGAMRAVASGAAFAHGLVFKHMRTALRGMTLQTRFVLGAKRRAAVQVNRTLVRRMTFRAGHPAFGHRVVAGQTELPAHVGVAGKADRFRRPRRRRGKHRAVAG